MAVLTAGSFIRSTAAMDDPVFENAIVFITEYNAAGAVGFIINKPFYRNLNELAEFKNCMAAPVFNGGPVDQEHLFFLHQRPDLIDNGTRIVSGMYNGGNFQQAVQALNDGEMSLKHIRIFVGYCGWDAEELENEIAGGYWQLIDADASLLFE